MHDEPEGLANRFGKALRSLRHGPVRSRLWALVTVATLLIGGAAGMMGLVKNADEVVRIYRAWFPPRRPALPLKVETINKLVRVSMAVGDRYGAAMDKAEHLEQQVTIFSFSVHQMIGSDRQLTISYDSSADRCALRIIQTVAFNILATARRINADGLDQNPAAQVERNIPFCPKSLDPMKKALDVIRAKTSEDPGGDRPERLITITKDFEAMIDVLVRYMQTANGIIEAVVRGMQQQLEGDLYSIRRRMRSASPAQVDRMAGAIDKGGQLLESSTALLKDLAGSRDAVDELAATYQELVASATAAAAHERK